MRGRTKEQNESYKQLRWTHSYISFRNNYSLIYLPVIESNRQRKGGMKLADTLPAWRPRGVMKRPRTEEETVHLGTAAISYDFKMDY